MSEPVLELEGIVKTFPGVRALDGVDFDLRPGEVHALMGENGAGKSTLMKVLAGMHQPDSGQIIIDGQRHTLPTPIAAKEAGIILIHQELSLAEDMTVAENIFLGELPRSRLGFVDWRTLEGRVGEILKRLNVDFGPRTRVRRLSIAKKQLVEIARALTHDGKVVVFDEPTASLTDAEKVVLFDIIASLQKSGVGIVYISHRMEEIFRISDRISILRDGSYRGTLTTAETDEDEVTRMMIGRSLDLSREDHGAQLGPVRIAVEGLSCEPLYRDVSFEVRAGEVLGFYGLVGAGRTEIAETLFGLRRRSGGKVTLHGEAVEIGSPAEAIANGLSLVPESRKEQGLVLGMNCRDNITLPQIDRMRSGPFISGGREVEIYEKYRERLEIKAPSWRAMVKNLSGGNQQKIVIGKWLSMGPEVLIVDEPTRGIDVGSKSEIHSLLRELAAQGLAVIVISSEMPEVLRVSDRIAAMHEGRLVTIFDRDAVTEDSLIQAISGIGEHAA